MLTRADGLAVVVYHRPGCPFSTRLRLLLTLHRVPFVSRRFADDRAGAARAQVAAAGLEVSPTVLVGDRWLVNPTWRQVAAAATGRV